MPTPEILGWTGSAAERVGLCVEKHAKQVRRYFGNVLLSEKLYDFWWLPRRSRGVNFSLYKGYSAHGIIIIKR